VSYVRRNSGAFGYCWFLNRVGTDYDRCFAPYEGLDRHLYGSALGSYLSSRTTAVPTSTAAYCTCNCKLKSCEAEGDCTVTVSL